MPSSESVGKTGTGNVKWITSIFSLLQEIFNDVKCAFGLSKNKMLFVVRIKYAYSLMNQSVLFQNFSLMKYSKRYQIKTFSRFFQHFVWRVYLFFYFAEFLMLFFYVFECFTPY